VSNTKPRGREREWRCRLTLLPLDLSPQIALSSLPDATALYLEAVKRLTRSSGGLFIITSCNFTEKEIEQMVTEGKGKSPILPISPIRSNKKIRCWVNRRGANNLLTWSILPSAFLFHRRLSDFELESVIPTPSFSFVSRILPQFLPVFKGPIWDIISWLFFSHFLPIFSLPLLDVPSPPTFSRFLPSSSIQTWTRSSLQREVKKVPPLQLWSSESFEGVDALLSSPRWNP